jgi:hypothetical protein
MLKVSQMTNNIKDIKCKDMQKVFKFFVSNGFKPYAYAKGAYWVVRVHVKKKYYEITKTKYAGTYHSGKTIWKEYNNLENLLEILKNESSGVYAPSSKQLQLAFDIAAKLNIDIPKSSLKDSLLLAKFIDDNKKIVLEVNSFPSDRQFSFLEVLIHKNGLDVSCYDLQDKNVVSKLIDSLKEKS